MVGVDILQSPNKLVSEYFDLLPICPKELMDIVAVASSFWSIPLDLDLSNYILSTLSMAFTLMNELRLTASDGVTLQ